MNRPDIIGYADRESLALELAALLADKLRRLIAVQGRASLAVPGGTTPGAMLTALGQASLDWGSVVVTLTDERWVPPRSARSNHKLIMETLLTGPAGAVRFVPLYREGAAVEAALPAVIGALREDVLPLDIVVLGMGADMHTASLFPGAVGLEAALSPSAPSALALTQPESGDVRVSLAAAALRLAGERHLLIQGADKRAALERALALGDPMQAPVLAVLGGAAVHYAA